MSKTTAFSIWGERIAPVFDVAHALHVVKIGNGRVLAENRAVVADEHPGRRALRLAELGVRTLVCGAISGPLLAMLEGYGIRVVAFTAGGLREVVEAWLHDGLGAAAFAMPGCAGRGRFRHDQMVGREASMIFGGQGGGRGQGAGRGGGGQGGGGGRGGRGGPYAAGPGGFCVCPSCGHRARHEPGMPCMRRRCPKCGSVMTRET